ncbi:MAG: hypothetical protein HC920_16110 [Oscillatoriales cyanobacterium SM2_3_0]|nr:hypothetical protein [Oscillatoriales cyanobacterium SM2_3_0]
MTQIDTNPASQSIEVLKRFNLSLLRSANLFRWVGYGFLLLTLLDIAEILFPPRFMNPAWELQAMGQLVERVAVPLLGFILVFFGERNSRERWEVPLVKLFSWLTLLYAVLYFLLVPLGVINTLRIDKQIISKLLLKLNVYKLKFRSYKLGWEQSILLKRWRL